MTTVYPGAIDALPRPSASTYMDDSGFEGDVVIDNISDAVEALENVTLGAAGANVLVDPGINSWPEGTSFSAIADGTWGPAGLIYRKSGGAGHDLLRSTDVPSVSASNPLANYSCHLDVTTADTSIAAGDYALIATRIEGYDWKRHLDQRQFSFGFWVKAAKTGTHCIFARNSGNDRSCVMEYTINAANAWEYKTVTFPASPSAGTWDYTTGRGIEIGWTQYAGTTFQTTAGAWQTGNFYATSNQVNEVDSTTNNFRLALLGPPTAGPVAAPFAALPISLEAARVARYIQYLLATGQYAPFGNGNLSTTTTMDTVVFFPPMRAAPTATYGTASDFTALINGGAPAGSAIATVAGTAVMPNAISVRLTITAQPAAGASGTLAATNTSAFIKLASRIP